MKNYVIFTDSACDISTEILNEWGVKSASLSYHFTNEEKEYFEGDLPIKEFYDKMRAGAVAKTSAVNVDAFYAAFKSEAEAGNDILYIGFSSGLSSTFNSGRLAGEKIKEEFGVDFIAVDTLAASAGQGLLVYLAKEEKAKGASMAEVAKFVEDNKMQLCHWFTVDDLVYLKRGGRVSGAAAFFGNMLAIKPVLHVDNEGHLVNVSKVRGRKMAVSAMADKLADTAFDVKGGTVFISHADCMADVEYLKNTLSEKYGATVSLVANVGAVIGSHAGPGTLALFFLGKER